jgi:hypothetical protein
VLLGVVLLYWLLVVVGVMDVDMLGAEGAADGVLEGAAEGTQGLLEGAMDGAAEGVADGVAEGVVDGVADGVAAGADALAHAKHGAIVVHGGDTASVLSFANFRSVPVTVSASVMTVFTWPEGSLEKGLRELSQPKVSLEVKQQPPPGFGDLLAQQISLIQNTLVPLLQAATSRSGRSELLEARVAELTNVVRQLADMWAPDLSPPPRFEVELTAHSPSNFYVGVNGGDVVEHGGLFLATFVKPPPIGSRVVINAVFPWREECDLTGRGAWLRERTAGQDDLAPPASACAWRTWTPPSDSRLPPM